MTFAKRILIIALAGLLVWTVAGAQEDMVTVDTSDFTDPRRPASVFRHDEHNETAAIEDCAECHHVYENGRRVEDESSEDQRCSDCHSLKAEDGRPALMHAFHANCKGCHMKQNAGPVMCGECHRR